MHRVWQTGLSFCMADPFNSQMLKRKGFKGDGNAIWFP
jgi:hypothetical protein